MSRGEPAERLLLAAWLALLAVPAFTRPLWPIDETRYVAVAWEMWQRGDLLVPFMNGASYSHKPPLLFWLIHLGWVAFGVNDVTPRLIGPAFAAATVFALRALATRLWPRRPAVRVAAPAVCCATLPFAWFAQSLMFDAMLAFFVVCAFIGLATMLAEPASARALGWLAVGVGGALYAKGPVALIHVLPAALLAPWTRRGSAAPPGGWRRWYAGVAAGVAIGALLILAWAIPAGLAGGRDYRDSIFWGQSAGRVVASFAHRAPAWFYVAWLPALLAPWLLWPRWWAGARRAWNDDAPLRLVGVALVAALVVFSAVSGKRWHYLLPELALFALVVARALDDAPPPSRRLLRAGAGVPALTLWLVGALAAVAAWKHDLAPLARVVGDPGPLAGAAIVALAGGAFLLLRRGGDAVAHVRAIASATVVTASALFVAAGSALAPTFDTAPLARRLAAEQRAGRPLAFVGDYQDEWTWAGRLAPLAEVDRAGAAAWAAAHPDAWLLIVHRRDDDVPAGLAVVERRPYRGATVSVVTAGSAEASASSPLRNDAR